MENEEIRPTENTNQPVQPIEHNYEAHKSNPGPAPTVNEPDNKGAGQALKWIIPIAIIALIIFYLFFWRNNTN
ncbi:MAG: hypothetical protein REI78_03670 [Pedobacter sp.]|nr:hypothetical protein [Pedobacter sp.]MDQ8052094.1 hypothetical protein [Pedobacter sp.]